MTTAPVRPVPALSSRLMVPTVPSRRRVADMMDHEVIPLLAHLDQVSPDVNQLLDRVSQLNHMTSRLSKVFRRRSDSKINHS